MNTFPPFAINARFLTQPVTGVQRYARNVIAAMSAVMSDRGLTAPLIAPNSAADPKLPALPLLASGSFSGHVWEQTVLPARWHGRLLNLCNVAPVVKTDQIVCIHDANVFSAPESYSAAFRSAYSMLQRALSRRAARIATVSNYSAQQIALHLPVKVDDIAVLPNGHEHALAWDAALARIAPSIVCNGREQTKRGFVLVLGSRARHKNLRLMRDVAPELAAMGLDIIVAGGGADIFVSEDLRALPNVKTVGYVTDHDLAYLMDRAVCLAFPSWTEGFGLPIIEAMARGCPVVSSDRASMPEVCGDAALLAPPDDSASWVRQIGAIVTSQDLRQTLVGRGRERIDRFSWAKTATGYLDLMQNPSANLQSSKATSL